VRCLTRAISEERKSFCAVVRYALPRTCTASASGQSATHGQRRQHRFLRETWPRARSRCSRKAASAVLRRPGLQAVAKADGGPLAFASRHSPLRACQAWNPLFPVWSSVGANDAAVASHDTWHRHRDVIRPRLNVQHGLVMTAMQRTAGERTPLRRLLRSVIGWMGSMTAIIGWRSQSERACGRDKCTANQSFLADRGLAVVLRSLARPPSIQRRITSERDSPLLLACASMRAVRSAGSRTVITGSWPVAGRPRPLFFCVTDIDFTIFPCYAKCRPVASANSPPALTTATCMRGSHG